uniref:Uncharacterized protein n=1 Tax=Panagrolaimus sp. ES5 TaxID=591445 RepID=A0AC34FGX2_9BILA
MFNCELNFEPLGYDLHYVFSILNLRRKAVDSKSVPKKKIYFTGPHGRREWSLPDSIMYYMAMNPKSAEVYQKLVKSCKYFYIKNPIVVVPDLR